MTAPRTISAEMVESMKAAAKEVWEQHEPEVPEDLRENWRELCKKHVGIWFGKKWGQG